MKQPDHSIRLYAIGFVIMGVSTLAAIVSAVAVSADSAVITIVVAAAGGIAGLVFTNLMVLAKMAEKTAEIAAKQDEAAAKQDKAAIEINHRLTELVEATRLAALAMGRQQGREALTEELRNTRDRQAGDSGVVQ
jgi:hypothetical protein